MSKTSNITIDNSDLMSLAVVLDAASLMLKIHQEGLVPSKWSDHIPFDDLDKSINMIDAAFLVIVMNRLAESIENNNPNKKADA